MDIRLVEFDDIDILKYDSCVHYSHNGNIFGYHWFLKNVVRSFDVLVEGDYESVMPLIHTQSRWGQYQLIHPNMIGRLGIFSTHVLSKPRMLSFIEHIPTKYKSYNILFNEAVRLPKEIGSSKSHWFFLILSNNYETLQKSYSDEVKQKIKQTEELELIPAMNYKPESILEFYKSVDRNVDEHAWMRIFYNLMHRGTAFPISLQNKQGELVAASLFAYHYGYLVNLFHVAAKGYEHIIYKQIDDIIRTHAGKNLTLDFNRLDPKIGQAFGGQKRELHQLQKQSFIEKIFS